MPWKALLACGFPASCAPYTWPAMVSSIPAMAAPEPRRLCVCDLGRKVGVKASATPASGLTGQACAAVPARSRRSQLPEGY